MGTPEKLYVDTEDRLSDSILYGFTEKRKDDDIEYTRTDAFIEKALEWIRKEIRPYYSEVKYKYEDFKNYMKGE
jgi:hypothetical protein